MNNGTNHTEGTNHQDDRFFEWLLATGDTEASPDEALAIEPESMSLPTLKSESADPSVSPSVTPDLPLVGDIPAVQTRFNALIERRLRVEIEKNLPLFPWETSILDYDTETAQDETVQLSWLRRLQQIELPIRLPDHTLASIFLRCQDLARQPLQEGLQIVRAIEHLFPNSDRWLHELTGTFLQEATVRDSSSLKDRVIELARRQSAQLPRTFDDASAPQQALLSMLVAREILQDLRFDLTANGATIERRWSLENGDLALMLAATREESSATIQVRCEVPAACTVRLFGEMVSTVAHCDRHSTVDLALQNAIAGQTYTLEINSGQPHTTPLQFAVRVSD